MTAKMLTTQGLCCAMPLDTWHGVLRATKRASWAVQIQFLLLNHACWESSIKITLKVEGRLISGSVKVDYAVYVAARGEHRLGGSRSAAALFELFFTPDDAEPERLWQANGFEDAMAMSTARKREFDQTTYMMQSEVSVLKHLAMPSPMLYSPCSMHVHFTAPHWPWLLGRLLAELAPVPHRDLCHAAGAGRECWSVLLSLYSPLFP